MKYVNPQNNQIFIRVMPGKPHAKWQIQRKPYVEYQKNGKFYDVNGNIVSQKCEEVHIPLEDFIYEG